MRCFIMTAGNDLIEKHGMSSSDVRVAYQSRQEGLGCLLVHASASKVESAGLHPATSSASSLTKSRGSSWHYSAMPSFLKVQPSVIKTVKELQAEKSSDDMFLSIPGVKDRVRVHQNKNPLKADQESGVKTSSLHVRFFQNTNRYEIYFVSIY
jgi:hypothetical protein